MKGERNLVAASLIVCLIFISSLLKAETDREMLVKRWKLVKHQKSGKTVPFTEDDFIQLKGDGIYEHARNRQYAKGSWALNSDELIINNNGEYKWKIISVDGKRMTLARGVDEILELEVIELPAEVEKTASAPMRYLCMGKWRPNEHNKGSSSIKFQITDMIDFFPNGTFEQIKNGNYSKGLWSFNETQTELTIDGVVWKIENITGLFFKISRINDPNEFIIFAKTR